MRTAFLGIAAALSLSSCDGIFEGTDNSRALFKLFSQTCAQSVGQPNKIHEWAKLAKLPIISDENLLLALVGEGTKGRAWELPSSTKHHFALSIRGETQACAVWAELANRTSMKRMFGEFIESMQQLQGITMTPLKDEEVDTATGKGRGHIMSYQMKIAAFPGIAFQITMIVADKTGTLFAGAPLQATIQVSPVIPY